MKFRFHRGLIVVLATGFAALALPASASAGYEYRSNVESVADGTQENTVADCDPGDKPISGGILTPEQYANGVYVNSLAGVSITGWFAFVDNYNFVGDAASDSVTVTVTCDNSPGAAYAYRNRLGLTAVDAEGRAVKVSCGRGEVAVGGGGSTSGNYSEEIYLSASAPFDSRDKGKKPEDGWRVEWNNDEGGSPGVNVSAFAVCDKRRSAKKYAYAKSPPASFSDGQENALEVPCPAGTELISGGVSTVSEYEHGVYFGTSSITIGGASWRASIINYDTPDDLGRFATIYAICRK